MCIRDRLLCLIPFCLYDKKARKTFRLSFLMLKQPQIEYENLKKIHVPTLVLSLIHIFTSTVLASYYWLKPVLFIMSMLVVLWLVNKDENPSRCV